ncbi:response regulator [Methanocalculus sp. MSAO_Arc2]|uniref:response regulator n=1 Tax=Methanocalculus sp. MSAO_Arc2 TaxID=2293855 RepID=UPI002683469B
MNNTKRILVVEDSTTQAEYLRRILESEGYIVDIAHDGNAALLRIADETPDLVLSDIVMPGLSGYELCEKIKQQHNIPVFLVTQLYNPEDVVRGVASGADNFIIKPFDPDFILKRVQELFLKAEDTQQTEDLSITISGNTYQIDAERKTILTILLSTYALAVQKNIDLSEAQDELFGLNEQLQEKNEALRKENLERERVEKALSEAHRKLTLVTSITRHGLLNQLGAIHESLEYTERILNTDPTVAKNSLRSAITGIQRVIEMTRFTQEYQKIGQSPPVWERLVDIIPKFDEYRIEIQADIPPDLSIYLDPIAGRAIAAMIEDAHRRRAEKVIMSCEEKKNSTIITIEDDGIGIPGPAKEGLFSYEKSYDRGFSLFLAREALAITGINLEETGDPRQGGRFEIRCPHGVVQKGTG